jgi:hypothetical protein
MGSKGMTSYERVYHALMETTTCKKRWAEALKALDEVTIKEVTWSPVIGTDTADARSTFHFTAGFAWAGDSIAGSDVSARNFMPQTTATEIIDAHFGSEKDVKTFNCQPSIVKSGGQVSRKTEYGREKEYQSDFHDHLLDAFRDKVAEKLTATTKRLRAEARKMKKSEAYRKAKEEALIGFCKDTITKALLPWHEMEQSILQDAWDQFICTAIMRT